MKKAIEPGQRIHYLLSIPLMQGLLNGWTRKF